jgi:hypothetical protein
MRHACGYVVAALLETGRACLPWASQRQFQALPNWLPSKHSTRSARRHMQQQQQQRNQQHPVGRYAMPAAEKLLVSVQCARRAVAAVQAARWLGRLVSPAKQLLLCRQYLQVCTTYCALAGAHARMPPFKSACADHVFADHVCCLQSTRLREQALIARGEVLKVQHVLSAFSCYRRAWWSVGLLYIPCIRLGRLSDQAYLSMLTLVLNEPRLLCLANSGLQMAIQCRCMGLNWPACLVCPRRSNVVVECTFASIRVEQRISYC